MSDYDHLVELRGVLLRVEAIVDRMAADSTGGYGVTGWAEDLREAIDGVAAEPKPLVDRRPHSRACGIRIHEHGPDCHSNCPTCGGRAK